MNGFTGSGLLAVFVVFASLSTGCSSLLSYNDTCYPERYWESSRNLVNSSFAPQVANGHVLDQTVWNDYFEPGCDRLNAMGLQQLSILARRRPHPDPVVFLQTAQDLPYDQLAPQQLAILRSDLDNKRKAAVEQFMQTQTANRGLAFQVVVHDPSEVGLPGTPASMAIQQMYTTRFRGGLIMTNSGTGSGGGASGGGSGGTGSGGSGSGGTSSR